LLLLRVCVSKFITPPQSFVVFGGEIVRQGPLRLDRGIIDEVVGVAAVRLVANIAHLLRGGDRVVIALEVGDVALIVGDGIGRELLRKRYKPPLLWRSI